MQASWWKILGVVLVLYTIIVGMLTPLKPGLTAITPLHIDAGTQESIVIDGYNTHFTDATRVWFKYDDDHILRAKDIEVVSSNQLKVSIDVPASVPVQKENIPLNLIVDSPDDGPSVMPSALFLRAKAGSNLGGSEWSARITDIHEATGFRFPYRNILNETIRNTFYHVPLWFSMFILLFFSVYFSILYLRKGDLDDDIIASSLVRIAVLYGVLGLLTGSMWARFTWGTFWTNDVKLNMAAVAMLIYVAYLILRSSIKDVDSKARLSSGYAIFAFVALIPLLMIIPRLTASLHPGNGGNPAIGAEDMENTMRMIFYPGIIGFTLIGMWMTSQLIREERMKLDQIENDLD